MIPGKSCIAMEMEVRDALVDNGAKPRADAMTAKRMMARNDISYVLRGRYERASVLNNCWVQTDDDNECSIEVWRRK